MFKNFQLSSIKKLVQNNFSDVSPQLLTLNPFKKTSLIIKTVNLLIFQQIYGFYFGGQGWIRTIVPFREQIYSLPPLATRPPTHIQFLEMSCYRQ